MTETLVLASPAAMDRWRSALGSHASVGFVPTMGALHDGHRALIERSVGENNCTVVSVFVNPAQFNVPADFASYPRTLDRDVTIAHSVGADVVFAPDADVMYPPGFSSFVEPCAAALPLEGAMRPGHFRGVTTIVNKLFNCVRPTRAYFGKKDFQQLAVIRGMVEELNMPVQIIGLETVREADGLAMSSRNKLLSPEERNAAPVIHAALKKARSAHLAGQRDSAVLESLVTDHLKTEAHCRVEYATVCDARSFERHDMVSDESVICVACWFGDVRLIDNLELLP